MDISPNKINLDGHMYPDNMIMMAEIAYPKGYFTKQNQLRRALAG
ncbi:MAG: hypothetical protein QGD96_03500 [Anaerolineae bacterium]|nr:hypothetical protein [Anaerolineae bacterium]